MRLLRVGRFVLPAGDAPVLAWFLEHLFVVHGLRGRARRLLLSGAVGGGRALLERLAGDPARDGGHPRGDLAEEVLRAGADGLPGAGGPGGRWILVEDYPDLERERVVAFLFPRGAARPRAVARFRRPAAPGASFAREAAALRRAREALGRDLRDTLPEPIEWGVWHGLEYLLLSCLGGTSQYVELHRTRLPRRAAGRHLEEAARWLVRFQEATSAGEDACGAPTASHGDYWPRNVLSGGRSDGLPGVVDWEAFRPAASPMDDLFHFPLHYGLACERGLRARPEEAFRRTFVQPNRLSRAVGGYLERWCRERGASRESLRDAFVGWLASGGGPVGPRGPDLPWGRLAGILEEGRPCAFCG